jgi:hypothetical protein
VEGGGFRTHSFGGTRRTPVTGAHGRRVRRRLVPRLLERLRQIQVGARLLGALFSRGSVGLLQFALDGRPEACAEARFADMEQPMAWLAGRGSSAARLGQSMVHGPSDV